MKFQIFITLASLIIASTAMAQPAAFSFSGYGGMGWEAHDRRKFTFPLQNTQKEPDTDGAYNYHTGFRLQYFTKNQWLGLGLGLGYHRMRYRYRQAIDHCSFPVFQKGEPCPLTFRLLGQYGFDIIQAPVSVQVKLLSFDDRKHNIYLTGDFTINQLINKFYVYPYQGTAYPRVKTFQNVPTFTLQSINSNVGLGYRWQRKKYFYGIEGTVRLSNRQYVDPLFEDKANALPEYEALNMRRYDLRLYMGKVLRRVRNE